MDRRNDDQHDEGLKGLTHRAWFFDGFRQAMGLPALVVAASLIGVGGLARDAGFSIEIAIASTLLIWAGPAQVLYFGAVIAKMPWALIALSISISSVRFVPMCVSLLPMLRTPRTRTWTLLLAAHCIAVTVWAESMRRIPAVPRAARMSFFFGLSAACILSTTISTAVGYVLIGELPLPFAAGLFFLTPIYFVATLSRNARRPIDILSLVFGLGLAPLSAYAPTGLDLMLLGLGAGTLAWAVQRGLDMRKASA
jgi:predicted branched-subunit amino acid permease